jgi:hypothetical protein
MFSPFNSILMLIALTLSGAIAQTALALTPVVSPKPDPKVNDLSYFQAVWTCTVKQTAPTQTGTNYTWKMKRALNDFWYIGQLDTATQGPKTHETMGYNTLSKKFGRTILTNDGGFVNALSDGWANDTWTWEGTAVQMSQQKKQGWREVVKKVSDREFTATGYTQDTPQTAWQAGQQQTCKKQTGLFPAK